MQMKFSDSHAFSQHLVSGGEVRITLVELGPLECLMDIAVKHHGKVSTRG
jgi:hypothetical protein